MHAADGSAEALGRAKATLAAQPSNTRWASARIGGAGDWVRIRTGRGRSSIHHVGPVQYLLDRGLAAGSPGEADIRGIGADRGRNIDGLGGGEARAGDGIGER